ncbi:hypothetical protein ACLOJK_015947 [Asimina triloba]
MAMHKLCSHQSFSLILFLYFLTVCSVFPSISSSTNSFISSGSSLSVERPYDVLRSQDGTFSAGFHSVGINAYSFAIWFAQAKEFTPVWMANREYPVNGRRSVLSLQSDGNLVLKDGARSVIWTTKTTSNSSVQLRLENTGNLVLLNTQLGNEILWQSFDSPTNTLLPGQQLTRSSKLVSSRSETNHSSGFYSLYFDNDNVLRMLFNGPEISSVYWPPPFLHTWESGRSTYNSSRIAVLDSSGEFHSSDALLLNASDLGSGPKRRLTMDFDGNLRVYSLDEEKGSWGVSWQAIPRTCAIHGVCGPNSVCVHNPERKCSCLPGFKTKDPRDLSQGCEPSFSLSSCDPQASAFIALPHVDFYGNDFSYMNNSSVEACRVKCLQFCSCKGFMVLKGECFAKNSLLNGYRYSSPGGVMYIRVPKNHTTISETSFGQAMELDCSSSSAAFSELPRTYQRKPENSSVKSLLWFASALGGVELVLILTGWCFIFANDDEDVNEIIKRGYLHAANVFKKFSYEELKNATKNFSEEIGRGGTGVVYKGVIAEQGVAAIKRLEGFNQREGEFLAEVSTIGRINHMNLIHMFGFCAQGKHRLLVYEYMEKGSLADNLSSNALDWERRFEIAVGTAKGLAYLHEECLEWVLHCDVKPQNILLDADYKPKVADFGLAKLSDRHGLDRLSFSTVRGTRGYMAPEWILNLPVTSKVDVYSYGIVVLEMVTGIQADGRLVPRVRDVMGNTGSMEAKMEEIKDPVVDGACDVGKMEVLLRVALQCVDEERDARPTMKQVVEMLLGHWSDHDYQKSEKQLENAG